MSNIKTLTYPQVAILWWNESKTSRPTYFEGSSFHDLINGQLVLVVGQSKDRLGDEDFKIRMSDYSPEQGFYAHPDNLIFLGEL
jgi:hypothetical protein